VLFRLLKFRDINTTRAKAKVLPLIGGDIPIAFSAGFLSQFFPRLVLVPEDYSWGTIA
jgi:hypothetical protein